MGDSATILIGGFYAGSAVLRPMGARGRPYGACCSCSSAKSSSSSPLLSQALPPLVAEDGSKLRYGAAGLMKKKASVWQLI